MTEQPNKLSSWHYDIDRNILHFDGDKTNYSYSMDCNDTIFDIDNEGCVIGIAMRRASRRLNIPRNMFVDVEEFNIVLSVVDDFINLKIAYRLNTEPHKDDLYKKVS